MKNLLEEKSRVFYRCGKWVVQIPLCSEKTFDQGEDALAYLSDVLDRVGGHWIWRPE